MKKVFWRVIDRFVVGVRQPELLSLPPKWKRNPWATQPQGAESSPGLPQRECPTLNPLTDPKNILSKRSIYFDFDSYVVKDEFRSLVVAHAHYLRNNTGRSERSCRATPTSAAAANTTSRWASAGRTAVKYAHDTVRSKGSSDRIRQPGRRETADNRVTMKLHGLKTAAWIFAIRANDSAVARILAIVVPGRL